MIFVFFGHPGAGKTTLVHRFAERHGIPGIDTDRFMTPEEREAAATGRYTAAMRHANILRYTEHVRRDPACRPHVALADGLPTNLSRRYLLDQFPPGEVTLVLVEAERPLWEQRLRARSDNLVAVGISEADAYIRANWEPVPDNLPHERISNVADAARVDQRLRELFARYAGGGAAGSGN